jgi:hypothetical protein
MEVIWAIYSLEDYLIEAYDYPETAKVTKFKALKDTNACLGGIDISMMKI